MHGIEPPAPIYPRTRSYTSTRIPIMVIFTRCVRNHIKIPCKSLLRESLRISGFEYAIYPFPCLSSSASSLRLHAIGRISSRPLRFLMLQLYFYINVRAKRTSRGHIVFPTLQHISIRVRSLLSHPQSSFAYAPVPLPRQQRYVAIVSGAVVRCQEMLEKQFSTVNQRVRNHPTKTRAMKKMVPLNQKVIPVRSRCDLLTWTTDQRRVRKRPVYV